LELIRGELKRMSPTGITRGVICIELGAILRSFVKSNGLGLVCGGETGFVVERNPDSVIAADVAFISRERLATREDREEFGPSAPDLAVEILSPGNTVKEINEKI